MGNFKVIGVVGMQGSGKTEVAKVASGLGIPSVRMGDVVLAELERGGEKVNEESVGRIASELRKAEGATAIAKRCVPLIEIAGKGKKAVLVDGIRGIAEVEEFRRVFGDRFRLVTVLASEKTRYSRISLRHRPDDAKGMEKFLEKDKRELSWGLCEALMLADFVIVNEGTLEELRKNASKVLDQILR